jgi:hypothetical protein
MTDKKPTSILLDNITTILNRNVFIFPVFKIKLLILNLNIFNFLCLLYLNYGLYRQLFQSCL